MLRALVLALGLASPALASDSTPFPLAIGGPFALIDDQGDARTQSDPQGNMQLLFFGYANCPSICATSLPLMGQISDRAADGGVRVTPVMITVDPERDQVGTMTDALAAHHPGFVGLTGGADALNAAYKAFRVSRSLVYTDPEYGPIYAHGSHIYLLDPEGALLTLIPPILTPERAAEIVLSYAGE